MSSYESAGHDRVDALIKEFAQVARGLHVSGGFEDSLRRLTATAVVVIAGCESASISLLENTGAVTWGATDQFARDADQIQYDEGEGPGLDAAIQERWIYTADLADDTRWPRCGARLRKLGVGSMFSCRLALDAAPDHRPGALNLYASTPQAFDTRDQMLAILLSSLGAVLVDAAPTAATTQLHRISPSHRRGHRPHASRGQRLQPARLRPARQRLAAHQHRDARPGPASCRRHANRQGTSIHLARTLELPLLSQPTANGLPSHLMQIHVITIDLVSRQA